VDHLGNVYVVDTGNNRIQKFVPPPGIFGDLTTAINIPFSGSILPDCYTGCLVNSNTILSFLAVPAAGYVFSSWQGNCQGTNLSITITVNGTENCTANFNLCANLPVKNQESLAFDSSLQHMYDDSTNTLSGNHILLLSAALTEPLHFDRDIAIGLRGGFDCSYSVNQSSTIIDGSINVVSGSLTVENIIIK
jgi:hypothetical protein